MRSRRSRPKAPACSSTWRRRVAGSASSTSSAPTSCKGLDTVEANLELGFPADARDYGIGNQILADLGLTTIRILTNNPKKLTGIDGFGLTVVEQVPIEVVPREENRAYLATKRAKLGHRLHHQDLKNLPDYEPEPPE
jgi:GTP cyclohydrolase II